MISPMELRKAQYAIRDPSGDQSGYALKIGPEVSRDSAPRATSYNQTSLSLGGAEWSRATVAPSGEIAAEYPPPTATFPIVPFGCPERSNHVNCVRPVAPEVYTTEPFAEAVNKLAGAVVSTPS